MYDPKYSRKYYIRNKKRILLRQILYIQNLSPKKRIKLREDIRLRNIKRRRMLGVKPRGLGNTIKIERNECPQCYEKIIGNHCSDCNIKV